MAIVVAMTNPTPLKQLVEMKLGQPLDGFVSARRQPRKSWRDIAAEIQEQTGVVVSHEALRTWYPDDAEQSADTPA